MSNMAHLADRIMDQIEGASIASIHRYGMVVVIDGVEIYVSPSVDYSGCRCCGDDVHLSISYHSSVDDRIADHGDPDPLGIE